MPLKDFTDPPPPTSRIGFFCVILAVLNSKIHLPLTPEIKGVYAAAGFQDLSV